MGFIFNGDWVDRGRHQLEVVACVFALKIAFPNKVVLLRGNHEDPEMNFNMGKYGFSTRCEERLGEEKGMRVFAHVHRAFEWLPLGCVVSRQILVVHGGIGNGDWLLSHLASRRRPLNHEDLFQDHVLWNVLWSDPIPDERLDSFGVHDSPRDTHEKVMVTFGKDITAKFCQRNDLSMIVRSHQAKVHGCGYEVMHDGLCARVFSARDYEGQENDGSILDIRASSEPARRLVVKPQVILSLTKSQFLKEPQDVGRSDSSVTPCNIS